MKLSPLVRYQMNLRQVSYWIDVMAVFGYDDCHAYTQYRLAFRRMRYYWRKAQ